MHVSGARAHASTALACTHESRCPPPSDVATTTRHGSCVHAMSDSWSTGQCSGRDEEDSGWEHSEQRQMCDEWWKRGRQA